MTVVAMIQRIERKRAELLEMLSDPLEKLCGDRILAVSRELDQLLVMYHQEIEEGKEQLLSEELDNS